MRCNRIRARWWARVQEELQGGRVVGGEFKSGYPGEVGVLEEQMSSRNRCPGWKKNRQGVGRDLGETKPREGVKRALLPLRLAHLLSITGRGGGGSLSA